MHLSPGIVNPWTGSELPVAGEAALSTFYVQQGIYPEFRKHLQFRDDKIDSRGASGPAYRQAGQTPKSLGLRIIRRLRETFVVNENEVFVGLGASGVHL